MLRHDWTLEQIEQIHDLPFPDLIFQAQVEHRKYFSARTIQRSTLLSIKTGGCSEDCAYCPQSSRYDTGVEREPLLDRETVLKSARQALSEGSTRFCMGAAWRQVKEGEAFEQVLDLVRSVSGLGLEVCCTLGMLTESQAVRLKEAGCHAYNHNLDSSPEYYQRIITTRTYADRLNTLDNVRKAGITVCCGGIVGMGETKADRLGLIQQLAMQTPHPESVPINLLVRVPGTPLGDALAVDPFDYVRMIATARIVLPSSMVRLSAGRMEMSDELQALCFLAGANSIFAGEKLLTTANPSWNHDRELINKLGMQFHEIQEALPEQTEKSSCCSGSCSGKESKEEVSTCC